MSEHFIEEVDIDIHDLFTILQIIRVANKHGLIDPEAYIPVGKLYNKLKVAADNMKSSAETLLTE